MSNERALFRQVGPTALRLVLVRAGAQIAETPTEQPERDTDHTDPANEAHYTAHGGRSGVFHYLGAPTRLTGYLLDTKRQRSPTLSARHVWFNL